MRISWGGLFYFRQPSVNRKEQEERVMGEVTEEREDDLDELTVESYEEDKGDIFFQEEKPEAEPTEELEEAQEEEPIQEESTPEEPETYEIDGEKVTADQIKEWKSGHMKDADYRQKTSDLADRKRELEQIYGPMSDEEVQHAAPEIVAPQETGEFDPYDSAQIENKIDSTMRKFFERQTAEATVKQRQANFNNTRSKTWADLQDKNEDLRDENSMLYKTATEVLNTDPGLLNTPLCDVYAVNEAKRILGPKYMAEAKAEGASQVVKQLGEQAPTPTTPRGGGDVQEDVLTAKEERLSKLPPYKAAALSAKEYDAYLKASKKAERLVE